MIDGSLILAARLAADLTQTQAAALVYCSQNAWSMWETGRARMPRGLWELFLIRIASPIERAAAPSPEVIKRARKAAGLTVSAAADLVHSSRAAWLAWETGRARMPPAAWALFNMPHEAAAPPSVPPAEVIRAARLARGLSQAEAAAVVLGNARGWVRWETGAAAMPLYAWALFLRS